MSTVITVDNVYKKFRLGEQTESLSELARSLSRRLFRSTSREQEVTDREFWALQGVSFTVGRGEAVGVIGHNGAGKSTLLKHLTGVLSPTRGKLTMKGRVSALIEIGAGFHPQLTGRENVFLNGVILGMSIADIRRKFDEIVDFSGLETFIDTPVRRYSSGMFARLGFAVAAHLDPEILLIDEVLSVGDHAFQTKGIAKMKSIVANGATVLFVSHNTKSVQDLCSRCLLMGDGKVLLDASAPEATMRYLELGRSQVSTAEETVVAFEHCTIHGPDGPANVVNAGDEITIEGTLRMLEDQRNVDVVIGITDSARTPVSAISLKVLGHDITDLKKGETISFSVRAYAHLLEGEFNVILVLCHQEHYAEIAVMNPPVAFYVRASSSSRGMANLYPALVSCEQKAGD